MKDQCREEFEAWYVGFYVEPLPAEYRIIDIWECWQAAWNRRPEGSATAEDWVNAIAPLMPADFKDWHENSPKEWPEVTAAVIKGLRKREALAWGNGMVLVPAEPTQAMLDAADKLPENFSIGDEYRAMVAAALKEKGHFRFRPVRAAASLGKGEGEEAC